MLLGKIPLAEITFQGDTIQIEETNYKYIDGRSPKILHFMSPERGAQKIWPKLRNGDEEKTKKNPRRQIRKGSVEKNKNN